MFLCLFSFFLKYSSLVVVCILPIHLLAASGLFCFWFQYILSFTHQKKKKKGPLCLAQNIRLYKFMDGFVAKLDEILKRTLMLLSLVVS